ncbi:MAG: heparinase II/III family protein [Gemmatimonadota bacterium]|nr:heparinase II/III family protein [Gemmatimonadota bacterium]
MAGRFAHWTWLSPFAAVLLMHADARSGVPGDFNGDGLVAFDDFVAFARNFGTTRADDAFDDRYDLNLDGRVSFRDFILFATAFGETNTDLREDPVYLDEQIKHISDPDLFAAMDLNRAGLEEVKRAVDLGDYAAAYKAWSAYWDSRPGYAYINAGVPYFTVEEAFRFFSTKSYTAVADRVAAHNITGWGGVNIQHGPVVDFNADYGSGGKYGFHYWEWSQPLLWAYLGTRNTKYLDAFDELFNQWYEQRDDVVGADPDKHPIWYELGLGARRNRVFLEFYRLNRGRLTAKTHERLLKNFLGSARWLYELQKQGYRSGNWQVMGSYALAELGLNFTEFEEAGRWISLGVHRIEEHLAKDFYEDGCHSERCLSSYSNVAYRDPRNLAHLLEMFGGHEDRAAAIRPPLERTLNHWMYLISPLGTQPAVNNGGRARFDRDVFVDGGRIFDRPDLLWVARNLLGADVDDNAEPPSRTSIDFRPSGFAVMRMDWTRESPYLVINYGDWARGHYHYDILSFELFAYGTALAVDAGLGVSYDDPLHRPWYITSKAHNMLVIDDRNLDRRIAVGEQPVWSSQEGMDYFAAEHRGYRGLGVRHRRHFLFVKPSRSVTEANPYFVVFDVFSSDAQSRTASFMLHSPTPLQRGGTAVFSTEAPGLLVATPDALSVRLGTGMAHLGGIPGRRPARQPIRWASLDMNTSGGGLVGDLAVLLYPFRSMPLPGVRIRRGENEGPGGTAYLIVEHGGGVDHIVIGDGTDRTYGANDVTTDAICALVRTDSGGAYQSHAAVSGTRLIFGDRNLDVKSH